MTEREIFLEALEMTTPEARAAYLQGVCGGDVALHRKVERLLEEHFANDSLLAGPAMEGERPGIAEVPVKEAPAQMIGRYKLLEKIGEGGFGEVWMAEQREPVKRRVALKILKPGMDSRQVVARFEAERQALALMDHANIARIFDAGVTDNGRPYFVMELVRGIKITEYCDQNQLPTRERLDLFIKVCHAIQHAHQKGIIHRDIKPSNILVTLHDGVPVPKVIDFGIAKATQQELTDKTLFTQFQQFIGTPAYISPEQAEMSGLDIDTRADIYSLGVLLYELLVGQTPFDAKEMMQGGLDALRQIIREKEPLRPSTKLNTLQGDARTTAGKRRQTDVGRLVHQLQGDLDWIAMKCLEKDRTRRYETASGLAMDIERHLGNEPVVARPPSRLYEFQKTVRRHKFGFAAAGAVMLALATGLGLATWTLVKEKRARERADNAEQEQKRQRQIAESKEKQSQEVAEFLKDMLEGIDPTVAMGRDTTLLREILDRTAERLGKDLKDQPALEAELRHTIAEVYLALGQHDKAEQNHREALALRQKQFGREHLEVAASLDGLARAVLSPVVQINFEAMTESDKSRIEEAEKLAREALEIRKKLLGNEHLDVAESLARLAEVLDQKLKYVGTESLHRQALEMRQRLLGSEHPKVADSLLQLARALRRNSKLEEAERLSREALRIRRKLFADDHPSVIAAKYSLARELKALSGKDFRNPAPAGVNMDAGAVKARLAESETLHRETLAYYRKLLPDDHPQVTSVLASLGNVLDYEWKLDEAADVYREVLTRRRQALGESHPQTRLSLLNLFKVLNDNNKRDKLEALVRDEVARLGAENTGTADWLAGLGKDVQQQRALLAPEVLFREELAIRRRLLGDEQPSVATSLDKLANVLRDRGQLQEAEQAHREALEIRKKVLGSEHTDVAGSLDNLALVLMKAGRLDEAEQPFREAWEIRRKSLGNDDRLTIETGVLLGLIQRSQDKKGEAVAFLSEELDHAHAADGKGGDTNSWLGVVLHHFAEDLCYQRKFHKARQPAEEAWALYQQRPSWPENERSHAYRVLYEVLTGLNDQAALESLQRDELARLRGKLSAEDPRLADVLANFASSLLVQKTFTEAEGPARESLAIREKTIPDEWRTFNSRSMVGGSLLGQKKYAEAESFLLSGYEGMKQREKSIPAAGKIRILEAIQRLAELYEATGKPEKAAEWKKKLEFDQAKAEK